MLASSEPAAEKCLRRARPKGMGTWDRMHYPAPEFIGGLGMPERDEAGERLATMLQHAAASSEGQTEVTLRNLKTQDEATKAQREAIEVQRKAAEAQTKAAEASVASAKAAEKAAAVAERNAKYMLWSVLVAAISAIASAVSAYYSYWSAVHPK